MKKTVNKSLIVAEYLQGGTSHAILGRKHGVSKGTVHIWVKKYLEQSGQKESLAKEPLVIAQHGKLNGEAKELQKAHAEIKLLMEIIEVAEKNLGINIRKKSGAAQ